MTNQERAALLARMVLREIGGQRPTHTPEQFDMLMQMCKDACVVIGAKPADLYRAVLIADPELARAVEIASERANSNAQRVSDLLESALH